MSKNKKSSNLGWGEWQRAYLPQGAPEVPDSETWMNAMYQVTIFRGLYTPPAEMEWPEMAWLSIKRRDKKPLHDWRHLQWIKNDLVGPECEGVELYPKESRLIDESNQYHLWVLTDPEHRFPFGYDYRSISLHGTTMDTGTSKQRPFPKDRTPSDLGEPVV